MTRGRRPGMTLLAVALLLACVAGFTQAEALKLERSPVVKPRFDRVVLPGCDCRRETATLSFGLRERDRIDVEVLDRDDEVVRVLATGVRRPAGRVAFTWDGRDDAGQIVPDGVYRVRVRLFDEPQTVVIPDEVEVRT